MYEVKQMLWESPWSRLQEFDTIEDAKKMVDRFKKDGAAHTVTIRDRLTGRTVVKWNRRHDEIKWSKVNW